MGRVKFFGSISQRMGCAGSKESENEGRNEDAGKSRGNGAEGAGTASGPPTADSRIPMTAKQKYSIVASWKAIHRAMEPTGILMFVK